MFGKSKGGRNANRNRGNRAAGLSATSPREANDLARGAHHPPPPPPQPPGMPVPVPDILPWLLISIASYAAFLYLPGRVSSPRARVTLIGGNEFINVASHIHFCAWIWIVQDVVFRLCAILLFPPKRAAVYFLGMFTLPSTSTSSGSSDETNPEDIIAGVMSSSATEILSFA